jgi:hypothetical protein
VYGLLDFAWDKYTDLCDDYQKQGLSALVDEARSTDIAPYLNTATADELHTTTATLEAARDSWAKAEAQAAKLPQAQEKCQELASELSQEKKLLGELWDLFKAYKSGIGYSSYPINQFTTNKAVSKELKARLPDLK